MKIYKCVLTDVELFSDTFPIEYLKDKEGNSNGLMKVTGKIVSQNSDVENLDKLIGGNKSEEAPDQEQLASESKSGIDIVISHRLEEAPKYGTKKDLQKAIRTYCKSLREHLSATPEVEDEFMKSIKAGAKTLIDNFENWEYFVGETMNPDGAMIFCDYEEDGMTPYLIFFTHGVIGEKV